MQAPPQAITVSSACSSSTTGSSVLLAATLLLGRQPVLKSCIRRCCVQPAPGGTTKAAAHGRWRALEKTLKDHAAKEAEKAQKVEEADKAGRVKMASVKQHKGEAPTALPTLPPTQAAGMAHSSIPSPSPHDSRGGRTMAEAVAAASGVVVAEAVSVTAGFY